MPDRVQFETAKVRSFLAPRWWQLRMRFRMWRWYRDIEREYNALPPHVRASVEVMQRRIDHAMFFGPEGQL